MLQAVGAERAILSILMKEPTLLFDIDDVLSEVDFTNGAAAVIYGLIKDMVVQDKNVQIDQYSLITMADVKGCADFIEQTHDGKLLEALSETQVNPSTLGRHVSAVKTMSIKRNTIGMLDEVKDEVEQSDGDAMDIKLLVEDRVYREMQALDSHGDDFDNLATDFEAVIQSYADFNSLIGLDVGLPRWQHDVGAFRNGTVTGVFARAKAGKSQFAAHCGTEIAIKQGLPILYLDTELQLRMQQMRVAGILSDIPFSRIESGAWKNDKEQIEKLSECFEQVKASPFIYKNIAGRSIKYVIPLIRKFFHKFVGESEGDEPKCLIIYDYVKLMDMGDLKHAAEWQVLGFLLSAIHDVAAQLNIPILCLGQLNREALRVDSESTIAGSDRITHNVDSMTIMRAKREQELDFDGGKRGNYIFKGILARNGPGHDHNEWVNVFFDKSSGQFKEDKRRSEVLAALQGMNPVADRLAEEEMGPFGELRQDES